jgi:tetratricopeptide (TPR) repeat protein
VILGTPAYLAPEQAEGGEVDARADQFGLAVMAFEALTGRSPWKGTSSAHVIAAILRDEPPVPSEVSPSFPRELDATASSAATVASVAFAPTEAIARSSVPTPQRTRAELVTEAERPPRRRPRIGGKAVALGGVALAAAALLVLRVATRSPPVAVVPDAAPPAPRATAMTDVPIPESKNPEATAAYRTGMQSFRDGSVAATRAAFQRAVALDPTYAAAHFRLGAVAIGQGDLTTARAEMSTAMSLRANLRDYERAMLEADEPLVLRSPPDFEETRRRVKALVDAAPRNAEYRAFLGFVDIVMHDDEAALAEAREALAIDPQFGFGYMLEAWAFAELGRHADALAVYDRCVEQVPAAVVCLSERAGELGEAGQCERMAADIERIIAASPEAPTGYAQRAGALLARGAPRETVEAAEAQATHLRPEAARAPASAQSREAIAVAFGDFASVARDAADTERALETTMDLAPQAAHALRLAESLVESGRPADAARVAKAYLQKRDLWIANGVASDARSDATPRLVAIARDAGAMSADDAHRAIDAFVKRWSEIDQASDAEARIWLAGAVAATTREEAQAALARAPEGALKAPPTAMTRAQLGEVYRLAGRVDDALPLLESGARACVGLDDAIPHARATLALAEAREAKGDAAGACAAYAAVIARWGEAKARSTTADLARARIKALACK